MFSALGTSQQCMLSNNDSSRISIKFAYIRCIEDHIILRYAIRSEVLIKYVHKNFKRILLLPLLIEHGVVFNLLKSLFLLQLFSFEAALLALYQLKVENSFSIIRCVSGCSLHSIMFVI